MIARLIAIRLVRAVVTLLAVSVVVFMSLEMLPGNYARNVLGQQATKEAVANLEEQLGLNQSAAVRYVKWISGAVVGDFGYAYSGASATSKRSVSGILAPRLRNTLFLATLTALAAVPIAMVSGLLAALYKDGWLDRFLNVVGLAFSAMPEFVVAYGVMLLFAIKLRWHNPLSMVGQNAGFAELLSAAALPATTLSLVIMAHIMRMTRAAIVNVMSEPYIETARLKGLTRGRIIVRHALPNVWAPVSAVIAFNLAYLVVGVVVVEAVFTYPGVGQLLIDAVSLRDMPVVQACILIFAAIYITLNAVADIIPIVTNPRLLHPR